MVKKPIRKDGSSLENVSALITSPCNKNRFHSTCNKLDRLRRRGYLYCIVILRLNSIVLVLFIDRYRLTLERYQTLVPNRLTCYSNVGLNSFSLFWHLLTNPQFKSSLDSPRILERFGTVEILIYPVIRFSRAKHE